MSACGGGCRRLLGGRIWGRRCGRGGVWGGGRRGLRGAIWRRRVRSFLRVGIWGFGGRRRGRFGSSLDLGFEGETWRGVVGLRWLSDGARGELFYWVKTGNLEIEVLLYSNYRWDYN